MHSERQVISSVDRQNCEEEDKESNFGLFQENTSIEL